MNAVATERKAFLAMTHNEKMKVIQEWLATPPKQVASKFGEEYVSIRQFANKNNISKNRFNKGYKRLTPKQQSLITPITIRYISWVKRHYIPFYLRNKHWVYDEAHNYIIQIIMSAAKQWKPKAGRSFDAYWVNLAQRFLPQRLVKMNQGAGSLRRTRKGVQIISADSSIQGTDLVLANTFASRELPPDRQADLNERIAIVHNMLRMIDKRTAAVIRSFYGIDCIGRTKASIAKEHRVTLVRIREILKTGREQIRQRMESQKVDINKMFDSAM